MSLNELSDRVGVSNVNFLDENRKDKCNKIFYT